MIGDKIAFSSSFDVTKLWGEGESIADLAREGA